MVLTQKEVKAVYLGSTKVRPSWPALPNLCFTAESAWSTIKLSKSGSPTSVSLETSLDWITWSSYTIWDTITLSNIWDKVYWRNTSETDTLFSSWYTNNYYRFVMTGSIAWSWDVSYLLNKNWTDTLGWDFIFAKLFSGCTVLTTSPELKFTTLTSYCYYWMFISCSSLTTAPHISATTLASNCCYGMFEGCTNLESLPILSATTLSTYCYTGMFNGCSKIKISDTQTWEYQTPYRIPSVWTWTYATSALNDMFYDTWWTKTWTILINTTYYTSNTLV